MIFLVITADCGIAITTCLVRVPLLLTTRRTASATSSNFSIWPSVIQPFSKGSEAKRSSTYSPFAALAQFDQLDAGRTDVQPDHRRVLCAPAARPENSRHLTPNALGQRLRQIVKKLLQC